VPRAKITKGTGGRLWCLEITNDHVEWAVVDRLRQMLEEAPHERFILFTTIVCWVVQRIRVNKIKTENDKFAARIFEELSSQPIDESRGQFS
jgi:uncharacterized membrane protein YheB (UPF0754 family)